MKRCDAWRHCDGPIRWIHRGGAIYCMEHRTLNRSLNWRKLTRAEQRLIHAGFKVIYERKFTTREAVLKLLKGK